MEEFDVVVFCYDCVYELFWFELFFKVFLYWVLGFGEFLWICVDVIWNVFEFELVFVLNFCFKIVGVMIGNDMSLCDIEGDNLFYFL